MFDEAKSAIRSGQRARARDLLTRLLKTGQDNTSYWIWMSAAVDTPKERVFCLKEALRRDPQNAVARRGLLLMGILPADPQYALAPVLQKRNWQARMGATGAALMEEGKPAKKPQPLLVGGALVVVIGLVSLAVWGLLSQRGRNSALPVLLIPTDTATATETVTPPPPTVPPGTRLPLAARLQATYTPTPLYVNTPHAVSEAYRIGLRAFQRSDWAGALSYFQQSIAIEPGAVDVLYHLGETYRQQGNPAQAIEAFDAAILKDAKFAPPYLGRARARLDMQPDEFAGAAADIQTALDLDPGYGEAYLEMASLQVRNGEPKQALDTLQKASSLLPESPLVDLYLAQAYLQVQDQENALKYATRANQRDITLLPAYRIIGEALQAQSQWQASLDPLDAYTFYQPGDAAGWRALARTQLSLLDKAGALESLDRALELEPGSLAALLERGDLLLEKGDAEAALDDFKAAFRLDGQSFQAGLGWGKALMALQYPGDAYERFETIQKLALTGSQQAERLFWRAQSLDALKEYQAAVRDYQALVALPKGVAEADWLKIANERIGALITKTATPRPSTSTPAPTPSQTRWPTATSSP